MKHLNLCIKWHATVLSFDDARQSCQSEGGDLAQVKTNAIKMYLQTVLGRLHGGKTTTMSVNTFMPPFSIGQFFFEFDP